MSWLKNYSICAKQSPRLARIADPLRSAQVKLARAKLHARTAKREAGRFIDKHPSPMDMGRGKLRRVSLIGMAALWLALSAAGCGSSVSTGISQQAPPRDPRWPVSKLPPRLGIPISEHFIALAPANGYNRVVQLVDAGDVNGDKVHDVDIVWRLANRVGAFTGWRRVILFGSRRLTWRNVETALKSGGAKRYPISTGLPTERYELASATGAYTGAGQAQTASTRDDRVEAHFPCADSPGCISIYTASRLIITNPSGKVEFAYGEDWGYNQQVYNLDRPISTAQAVRRFGAGGRPVVLFSSPTGGVRAFGWIDGHVAQMKLRIAPGSFTSNELLVPMPIVVDVDGDGVDEIVGVGASVPSRSDRALGIVIVEHRRN